MAGVIRCKEFGIDEKKYNERDLPCSRIYFNGNWFGWSYSARIANDTLSSFGFIFLCKGFKEIPLLVYEYKIV